jgi:hypothetical protein
VIKMLKFGGGWEKAWPSMLQNKALKFVAKIKDRSSREVCYCVCSDFAQEHS